MLVENSRVYSYLWNKYRPVILQLMSASSSEPQEYKLFPHEFQSLNPRQKGGYAFTLEASRGKALNDIRKSPVALDLLQTLQQSRRAVELMEEATFELSLDKNFVLHVNRKEEKVEEPEETEETEEPREAGDLGETGESGDEV